MSADKPTEVVDAQYRRRQDQIDELEISVNKTIEIIAVPKDDGAYDEELPYIGGGQPPHGDKMATESELTSAKIAAAEARTETRYVELNAKIDRIADSIAALTAAVTSVRSEVKEDSKFTRWTIGGTIIASFIAFGAALWVTQGNMLAAFTAGLTVKDQQAHPPSVPNNPQ